MIHWIEEAGMTERLTTVRSTQRSTICSSRSYSWELNANAYFKTVQVVALMLKKERLIHKFGL